MTKLRLARVPQTVVYFGPFRLDPSSGQLWRHDQVVHLRPKTWEVLCLLVANAEQLLNKEDVIDAVWSGAAVSDTMPSISVAELRRALDDDSRNPRFIETIHGRGFRFIATLERPTSATTTASRSPESTPFVGRRAELATLESFISPTSASCRLALISGEAGIGKTSLVDELIRTSSSKSAETVASGSASSLLFARGQCLSHFGEGYPYWPVLGALSSMGQARQDLAALMRTVAPSWLARIPSFVSHDELEQLRSRTDGVSGSRLADELFALLRAVGPVVWILEDLHWADTATVELIALAAESFALDQFWIVGTLRLAEAVANSHGIARIRRELRRRGRCREIMLSGLTNNEIDQYLALRFSTLNPPSWLPDRLMRRTNGNPFFLVHTVDHLENAGVLHVTDTWGTTEEQRLDATLAAIPATLRELVQDEISCLTAEEQAILGAASLVGLEFDAATAATAIAAPVDDVDSACDDLVRRLILLTRIGETAWPNGTASGRYAFRHALYQKVLHDDQAPAARRVAHCRIGHGMIAAYGERTSEIVAIVADHFERGGDHAQAVLYHQRAAHEANCRHDAREAAQHLRHALALLPSVAERDAIESVLLSELGKVLPAVQGFGDPNLLGLYMQVRGRQVTGSDASHEITAMAGLLLANLMQHKSQPAEELAREMLELADHNRDAGTRACAELLMGAVLYHHGDLSGTIDHADRSLELAPAGLKLGPIEHSCTAHLMSGAALWQAGRPDEGLMRALPALDVSRGSGVDPFNIVISLQPILAIHHWRGEATQALPLACELARLTREQGITQAEACAALIESWARFELSEPELAANKLEIGLSALRLHGSMMQSVYLLTVAAEVLAGLGNLQAAAAVLDEAEHWIGDGAARWWEPEIHRWRATLLDLEKPRRREKERERHLQRSLDLSEQQGSNSLRLRTQIDFAQLRLRQGRKKEAVALLKSGLREIHDGADTRDVRNARELLSQSGGRS